MGLFERKYLVISIRGRCIAPIKIPKNREREIKEKLEKARMNGNNRCYIEVKDIFGKTIRTE